MNPVLENFLCVFKCPVCLEPIKLGEEEGVLCPVCRAKFESEKREVCVDCGLPAPLCRCPGEYMPKNGSGRLVKLSFYRAGSRSATDRLIVRLKHCLDRRAFDFTAGQLAPGILSELAERGGSPDGAIVTYAPRSAHSERRDGFDQGRELSLAISRKTGIRHEALLFRLKHSRMQKSLDPAQRHRNAADAFRTEKGISLAGRTVILVDDVVTTGSTMSACAELLKRAGAGCVICVAIAKTRSDRPAQV